MSDQKALGTDGLDYLVQLIKNDDAIMRSDIDTLMFAVFNEGSNPWVVTLDSASDVDLEAGYYNAETERVEA